MQGSGEKRGGWRKKKKREGEGGEWEEREGGDEELQLCQTTIQTISINEISSATMHTIPLLHHSQIA